MPKYRAPRNYLAMDKPLLHDCKLQVDFDLTNELQNSTIIPLFYNDEALPAAASGIPVNPENNSFQTSTKQACYTNSIVPRLILDIEMGLSELAIETDKIKVLKAYWAPIYFAFEEMYDAEDIKTADKVSDIIPMTKYVADFVGRPTWSGTDMDIGSDGLLGTEVKGLTTDQIVESVAFDQEKYYDCKSYYTNSGMVKKAMPKGLMPIVINKDRNKRIFSNNFTYPLVKRMNRYTFCGILIHLPLETDNNQLMRSGQASAGAHLLCNINWRYEEWNTEFDQSLQ